MPSFRESAERDARIARREDVWSVVCYREQQEECRRTMLGIVIDTVAQLYDALYGEKWDVRAFTTRPGMKLQTIDSLIRHPDRCIIQTFTTYTAEDAAEIQRQVEDVYRAFSLHHVRSQIQRRV